MLGGGGHESVHHAIGINETVSGAEAATEDVVRAKLRQHVTDFVGRKQARRGETKFFLALEIVAQVREVGIFSGEEEIALRAVISGMADDLFKPGIEGNRVQRHLYVHRRGELRTHASHALTGGALALRAFTLDDQHALAARMRKMPGDAGADDSAADDDYVRRVHAIWASWSPIA